MDPKTAARQLIERAPQALRPYVQSRYSKQYTKALCEARDLFEQETPAPVISDIKYHNRDQYRRDYAAAWEPAAARRRDEIEAAAERLAHAQALDWLQSLHLTTNLAAPHSDLRDTALHLATVARELSQVLGKDGFTDAQRDEARQYESEPRLSAQYAQQRAAALHNTCLSIAWRDGHDVPDVPLPTGDSLPVLIAKMGDAGWWLRHILRTIRREREMLAFDLELVRDGDHRYASDFTVSERAEQLQRTALWMQRTTVMSGGTSIPLAEIARTPRHRRSQMYRMMQGMSRRAMAEGRGAAMITLTTPSHFHPFPSWGKKSWDGVSSPRDAHEWIQNEIWLPLLKRRGSVYGASFREPQKDGTTHWHVIAFLTPAQREQWREYLRTSYGYSTLQELDTREIPGGHWQDVEGDQAAAVMYAAKYVAKGTSDADGSKHVTKTDVDRLDAWRATWGIRSFQFFGLPRGIIGLWREYRRLSSPDDARRDRGALDASDDDALNEQIKDDLNAARWRAARRGDFQAFWGLVQPLRDRRTKKITRPSPRLITETIETKYGEEGKRVIGIDGDYSLDYALNGDWAIMITRDKQWTLNTAPAKPQQPQKEHSKERMAYWNNERLSAHIAAYAIPTPRPLSAREQERDQRATVERMLGAVWSDDQTEQEAAWFNELRTTLLNMKVSPTSSRGAAEPPGKSISVPPQTAPPTLH